MQIETTDVLIVGGGVSGTALGFVLGKYTPIQKIVVLEKNDRLSAVNSHPLNNSQTSHDGGTETNYSLDHALKIKQAAIYLRRYVESKVDSKLFRKTKRMVLGVGTTEIRKLEERFKIFSSHYPDLNLVYESSLKEIEPKVMEGRSSEPVAAIVSDEGYAIDYQRLSKHFAVDAERTGRVEVRLKTKVLLVEKHEHNDANKCICDGAKWYIRTANYDETEKTHVNYFAKVVVFAAGPYSLLFAQNLGYGLDFGILPVAGSFFSAGDILKNKVYRVQIEGRPFAEIHGDPDVLNEHDTRFGPTTKPLPLFERHHYETIWDFLKLPMVSWRGLKATIKILYQNKLFGYVLKNFIYDLPGIGRILFLREARIIVPSMRLRDIKLRRGVGGIRPQIVDLKTGNLLMGDATIIGENIIFNTTPSPGASVCLSNAKRDSKEIVKFLVNSKFDEEKFESDLSEEIVC